MFSKGTQSTKALEFVLWFLFTRLDQAEARERFKECWPILDRHDAREFRNVAFKWLEELRKEGCFGIGHNLNPSQSHVLGLGLFLPTIRRSYLDESIGERIEQLVLILSTYVLSRTIMKEVNEHAPSLKHQQRSFADPAPSTQSDDRELLDLVSRVPESVNEEGPLMASLESHIVRQSQIFIQEMERQKDIRQTWSSMSSEMTERLQGITKDLDRTETERRGFLAQQPQLAERVSPLSLHELHILEDRWIEKINHQWTPILSYVERHVGRKQVLQSLLDADARKGDSVLDGQSLQLDLPMTLRHMMESGGITPNGDSRVDLAAVLKVWKRSLQVLKDGSISRNMDVGNTATSYVGVLETLSKDHNRQLEGIQRMKKRLEARLKESSQRVERLKREQKTKQLPYRRLLTAIPVHGSNRRDLEMSGPSESEPEKSQDALASAKHISSLFKPAPGKQPLSSTHITDIRNHIHETVRQKEGQDPGHHISLREVFDSKDASSILTVRQTPVAVAPPVKPIVHRQPTAETIKAVLPTTSVTPSLSRASSVSRFSIIRPPASIRSRPTTKPPPVPVYQTVDDEEIVEHEDIPSIFDIEMDLDGLPGTPSKRRRVDSSDERFSDRRISFGYEFEVPLKDDTTHQSRKGTPSFAPRVMGRSPELTVDDLRAFTPKPSRTRGTQDNGTMPLMLLHTPQQRKLFGLDKDQSHESTHHPFPALSPPSTSDTDLVRRAISSPFSPVRSELSSSIFSRFRKGVSLQSSRNMMSSVHSARSDNSPPPTEASPFIVSSDPGSTTAATSPFTSTAAQSQSQARHTRPQVPIKSPIFKRLLAGNSGVLDRLRNDTPRVEASAPSAVESGPEAGAVQVNGKTNVASTPPASSETQEDEDDTEDDQSMTESKSSARISGVDFRASRNPWGRPPSWKPKSPSMVDIERRREAERARRRAAKEIKPMPPLDTLSKGSVYGRASISVPSSTSVSFNSSTSTSSRSLHSDAGHPAANRSGGKAPAETVHEDAGDEGEAEAEAVDKDDDDTQEYRSPPVSPIRVSNPGAFLAASMRSTHPKGAEARDGTNFFLDFGRK